MEVAGLALGIVGALPMIVQVVHGYQMINESARVVKYMAMLEDNLKTEEVIMGDICETLLNGIVPDWEHDKIRKLESTSEEWQTYDRQIRTRLRGSYDSFHLSIKTMEEAVQELKERLPRRPSREAPDNNWSSKLSALASEVKLRTSATLKKKDCEDALTRIRENNARLARLVSHGMTFETTRRARSRAKFAREFRTTAKGLFSAVRKVMRCQCIESHTVGLHLRQRMDEGRYSRTDVGSFEMIFGTTNGHDHNPNFDLLNIQWKQERTGFSPHEPPKETRHTFDPLSPEGGGAFPAQKVEVSTGLKFELALRSSSSSKSNRHRQVGFSQTITPIAGDDSTTDRFHDRGIAVVASMPPITDLCAYIRRGRTMEKHPVGFISCVEAPEGFDLSWHNFLRNSKTKSFTLRDALKDGNSNLVNLELPERFNIALALSFGMLQLCNTQWIGKMISLDDIILFREASARSCFDQSFQHPSLFLVRQPSTDSAPSNRKKPVNFALLSLGVVLTHLIMGRQVEAIDMSEDMTKEVLISKKNIACDEVGNCGDASTNYEEAVRWCFLNCFTFRTLEDESLSREFHDAVIARLENDLSFIHD